VLDGGRWSTYAELGERAARLARALARRGIGPGARVAALLPNGRDFLELYFAAPLAGAILVPLNVRLPARDLANLLRHSGSSLLLAHPRFAETAAAAAGSLPVIWASEPGGPAPAGRETLDAAAEAAPEGPDPPGPLGEDSPAQIYYTSGTTGDPKGVVLTHRNVCTHALMALAEIGISDRDAWLHAAPMFHLADAWASFAVTWAGGRHVTAPSFDPEAVLGLLETAGITLTNLVPTMLHDLVARPGAARRRYPSLRLLLSGGAPIAPSLVRRVMEVFRCEYWQTYGLTETSPYLTISKPKAGLDALSEEARFWYRACTGRPLAGVELRVADEAGRDVPADRRTVGEILARGPTVTPGYWENPAATREAFREGWFRTGDLAVLDREGYVQIVDRKKDMIVTGGEKVYSVEVEAVLCGHPGVAEAAVVGVPNERWGEAVKAVVVRRKGAPVGERELIDWCRERLAGFQAPKTVDFVEALPRTGSGKVCKREVRDRCGKAGEKRGD
jgi:acyl-CoA synthetase (AMP-forming)/AMP-acid ligase II